MNTKDSSLLEKILKEMQEEVAFLNHYSEIYYNFKDNPEMSNDGISDDEWDMHYKRLKSLESEYPELILPNSPTQNVGAGISSTFEEVQLEYKLASLDKVNTREEIADWIKDKNGPFVLERKIDGLTTALTYLDGKLVLGTTRGTGTVGEDITENVKAITNIPKTIPFKGKLVVAGEVYMPKPTFEELNKQRELNGEPLFANPRNAAAGSLRQHDVSLVKERKLAYFTYFVKYAEGITFKSHVEALNFLMEQNFSVPEFEVFSNKEEIINACISFVDRRNSLDYEIDGMVIKIDDMLEWERLGETSKFPHWAIAYKFPPEIKKSLLENVIFQVGRTGAITPVGIITPVSLAGTTVSRATLHNFDDIQRLGIKIGDIVEIKKSGDIIPKIIKSIETSDVNTPILPPEHCPDCGGTIIKDGAIHYCTNFNCPTQLSLKLMHFCSRKAMNIETLGEKVSRQLVEKGLVRSFTDLYRLRKEDLLSLDKFAEKKADNLLREIENSKNNDLTRLLYGLGIKYIGYTATKLITQKYHSMDEIRSLTFEDLISIDGLGEISVNSILNSLNSESFSTLLEELKEFGINPVSEVVEKSSTSLSGLTFVITGTLSQNRDYFKELIESNAGTVTNSISKKTNYLLAGDNAGSKLEKAKSLGISVITEEELYKML